MVKSIGHLKLMYLHIFGNSPYVARSSFWVCHLGKEDSEALVLWRGRPRNERECVLLLSTNALRDEQARQDLPELTQKWVGFPNQRQVCEARMLPHLPMARELSTVLRFQAKNDQKDTYGALM